MGRENGFTLIEVLVAVVLVAVGLISVAAMQTTAIRGNSFARETTISAQLAEEMVERIRVNALTTPEAYDGIDTTVPCAGTNPALGDCQQWAASLAASGLPGVNGQVAVAVVDPAVPKASTVTVTVSWGTAVTRTVTFTTILETWLS
jgi:type IV pilus assembly protein PilV